MSEDVKYLIFLEKMRNEISNLTEMCFAEITDVEVQWTLFREQLRKIKSLQKVKYIEYLNSDDE